MICQRVDADYSVAATKAEKDYMAATSKYDYLMIDSGAQACVCSPQYYPDIAIVPLMPEHTPALRTVTGDPMACHGVKYVDYVLSPHNRMTVRYYVCVMVFTNQSYR